MADVTKYAPINGRTLISDFKSHFSLKKSKRTAAYGFMFVFIGVTIFLAFAPSSNSSSPWFTNIFTSTTTSKSDYSYRSHFSSLFSYFFPNSSTQVHNPENRSQNTNLQPPNLNIEPKVAKNQTQNQELNDKVEVLKKNITRVLPKEPPAKQIVNSTSPSKSSTESNKGSSIFKNQTQSKQLNGKTEELKTNQSSIGVAKSPVAVNQTASSKIKNITGNGDNKITENGVAKNLTSSSMKKKSNASNSSISSKHASNSSISSKQGSDDLIKSLMNCDLFDGNWVRDDSYPLYKPGSCSLIDEQFNCFQNGRPDNGYHQLRWKPKGCTLPRLNASHMLELLRGKRLVFVGDSLNRNMWESLVCILKNSVKDQSKVYEEFGRHHFRNEASYSFIFEDYKCTVEFFVSPFLVQEWEVTDKNRTRKETLRLDIIERSADKYKNADFIVFNTGHWWTHDKTSKGKDYYQEGSHVYNELNVLEAFRKALTTWGRWVDANVNPMKTLVFFRGYSKSHFSGGQWNSGGQCDHETEPIKNEKYLTQYPPKMTVLERVLKGMKTPVTYFNITRMTDYRKDGHPSIYRKQKFSSAEKKLLLRVQDCSHWCLPGVPDAWNEILYAELLVNHSQRHKQKRT